MDRDRRTGGPARAFPARVRPVGLAILAIVLALEGCGQAGNVLGPGSDLGGAIAQSGSTPALAPKAATSSGGQGSIVNSGSPTGTSEVWYKIAEAEVRPDEFTTVGGGRYELSFPSGALNSPAVITISEWDSHVLDCELGPEGIRFNKPVLLRIDYSGTTADPGSSLYNGSTSEVRWLNPRSKKWEVLPGRDDRSQLKYYVELTHFSRYALFGKAGW